MTPNRCYMVLVGAAATLLLAAAREAQAQKLTKIGSTSVGTPVMLESRSVTRAGDIVTATVRAVLQPPMKTPKGDLKSSRTVAMFNCGEQTVATKERWFYYDENGTKEARHDRPGIPGFAAAFKGSLSDVALMYLCTAGGKSGAR